MKRPKILIIDDERFFVNILIDLLDPDYELEVAGSGEKAIEMASTSPVPDLILLDILIPDIDGYEICARLKEDPITQQIPIIFLTVKSDVEDEAKGLGLGAVDYITKPISPPILKARVRTQLLLEQAQQETERYSEHLEQLVNERTQELTKEIAERKKVEEHLRIQANYDPLTRLPNRALYMERLSQAIKHAQRNKLSLSVLLIDLDNFKIINDTMGHHIGDVLLVEAANRLKNCIRDEDTVARLGGDEFLLILLEISEQESAAVVAKKLLNEMSRPFTLSNSTHQISASIGITTFPHDTQDIDGLIKNADVSMYQAKKKGRNRFEFFTPDMTTKAQNRLSIAKALRKGLENNELVIHYQPIVDMMSTVPVATEALVRWNHPDRGLLSPSEFIPVAEETDLIDTISQWALYSACTDALAWQSRGLPALKVAVNCSRRLCANSGNGEMVTNVLDKTGFPAEQLSLEITEDMVNCPLEGAAHALLYLKSQGVTLTMDDFGTGYSSLSSIKQYPIDVIKIDRSFIKNLPSVADDSALVTAIIAMAHALDIKVIAEGVETEEQVTFLRNLHCDMAQGFYFGIPIPSDQFELYLQKK